MYHKQIKPLPRFFFNIFNRLLLRSYPNYQPIYFKGNLRLGSDRNCMDRWGLIKSEIESRSAKSLVDLGCAEGFYVLQSAKEYGCFALGVDADSRRLAIAQNQIVEEKIAPAGFMHAVIDFDFLNKLPDFDSVIFMSVMHHMMYSQGVDFSREILKHIRAKTKKFMIFEMGQSDETKNQWAARLPDMGADPHAWIAEFIRSAGFSEVKKIGESDSYMKDRRRAIFVAIP